MTYMITIVIYWVNWVKNALVTKNGADDKGTKVN
jgi:hypothetical protein